MKKYNYEETGQLEYKARAFQQDAQQAMGGKIEKALVELITNSDDSYAQMERLDGYPVKGRILIEIERRRVNSNTKIIVRDKAEGMSREELKKNLTALGVRASGLEKGQAVRGVLGRGAKDVAAFGTVTWQSIKEKEYSYLELSPNGKWKLNSQRVTDLIRKELKIEKENGTVVTVDVDKRYKIPLHKTLCEKLPSYYNLRDIMSDDNRKVLLQDSLSNSAPVHLKYAYPNGEIKLDNSSFTVPGYPNARASLTIYYHNQRFNEDRRNPYRQGGILVKSKRAIHEITLLGYENEPYAEYFSGKLECPYIDEIVNEFDDIFETDKEPPKNNPMRLITRTREGLEEEHPFRLALWEGASQLFEPLISSLKEQDKEKQKKIENEETKNRLNKLASAASKFLLKKLKELEEDLDVVTQLTGEIKQNMIIIPPQCKIETGEKKTFSIRAKAKIFEDVIPSVQVQCKGSGFECLTKGTKIELLSHPKYEDEVVGHVRIKGLKLGGNGTITAVIEHHNAEAGFEIVDKIPKEQPTMLCFEHKVYTISYNKEKTIRILAPKSLINQEGSVVRVYSDKSEIVLKKNFVELDLEPNLGFAIGYVRLFGRQLDIKGIIRATLGTQSCYARVQVAQEGKGIPVKFEIFPDDYGNQRAIWDKETPFLLKIAAKHPVLKRYLGRADDGFPGQTSLHCKSIIAEIIAEKITEKFLLIEEEKKESGEDLEFTDFYSKHQRLLSEFLPIAHEIMISSSEI